MNKEVKNFIRELKTRGWKVERHTGSGHLKLCYPPGGSTIVPTSPSDRRWLHNAWGDIRRIEGQYGPYEKPEKIALNNLRGLDYSKPEEQTPMIEPVKENVLPMVSSPPQKPTTQIANKDLIVSLLKRRRDELTEKLRPYSDLIIELEQIAESLRTLTGEITVLGKNLTAVKTDEEKIKDFVDTKPLTKPTRYRLEDMYKLMQDVVIANNNKMTITELCTWMHDVHGLNSSNSQSLRTKLLMYINTFNRDNPTKSFLVLVREGLEYTSVKYSQEFSHE